MKKILITGISGFAGSHLAEYLHTQQEGEIIGTYLSDSSLNNLPTLKDTLLLHKVDLMDSEAVLALMSEEEPDIIYHLAALPSPGNSFKDPGGFLKNNIIAELNILEAVKSAQLRQARVLIISSAEVYGLVRKEDLPIDEKTPMRPINPYAVSKIAQDYMGLQYHLAYGMDVIRVRPFGHIGPRQSPDFAVSAFAKKIAEIEKGTREPILTVGNLTAKRDLTDVRDVVRAYVLLATQGKAGELYNIGSGISYAMSEIVEKLLTLSSQNTIQIKEDPQLLRPSDIPELICNRKKLTGETGWNPEILLEQSLKDTLDYWRNIV